MLSSMSIVNGPTGLLLRSPLARRLYHDHAADLPVIDYHCHLPPADLAADRQYSNLTELWIEPDQYKHRALRILGVPEGAITGAASPREKFLRWASALPQLMGSPLSHWSAMELQRAFGFEQPLSGDNADEVWAASATHLAAPSHSARALLHRFRVELLCTSDQWLDDLAAHRTLGETERRFRVLPSLRSDEALAITDASFPAWIRRLGDATGVPVEDLDSLVSALCIRLDHFADHGCSLADHGIDTLEYAPSESLAASALARALAGTPPDAASARAFQSVLLLRLASEYARRGWTLQLHLGAQRHTSSRLRRLAGRAGGFAAIGAATDMDALCRLLDDLERRDALPRIILFPLHPGDFAPFASLTGSFAEDDIPGKLQLGPPWWFNDHDFGLRQHFDVLSRIGVLSTFIGMTTDARTFLSMSRHDYFRRVLCDWVAQEVAGGRLPEDESRLGALIRKLAYENARARFNMIAPSSSP
jgi:glucuronate isomerase